MLYESIAVYIVYIIVYIHIYVRYYIQIFSRTPQCGWYMSHRDRGGGEHRPE